MDAALMKKAEELANEVAVQATTLEGLNRVVRSLMSTALEKMLNAELEAHLGDASQGQDDALGQAREALAEQVGASARRRNRKNGSSRKTIRGDLGKLPLAIPRDRLGTFEPQLIGKYQRRLAGFDEKSLALYAKGLSTRDIQQIVKELYHVDISPTLISEITEDLDAEVKAWQTRRLEGVWPIVFLDGIVVHIRSVSQGMSANIPCMWRSA